MPPFVVGLGLGAFVAAQLGPVSLLLIRSVLRGSLGVGLAMGAAVAVVDLAYAGLGVAGAAPLLQIGPLEVVLGLGGAGVLLFLGVRTVRSAFRIRLGAETDDEVSTARRAFMTALIATASNPLTIASWAAVFAAASVAGVARTAPDTVALLMGVGIGSGLWYVVLSGVVAVAGRRIGPQLLAAVDAVAGLGLVGFGGVLAVRTVRD